MKEMARDVVSVKLIVYAEEDDINSHLSPKGAYDDINEWMKYRKGYGKHQSRRHRTQSEDISHTS